MLKQALFRDRSRSDFWEDGELLFSRGWRENTDGSRQAVLVVLPATEHPTPASLDRLAHEYALRDKLDPAWAVKPLALEREGGRGMAKARHVGSGPRTGETCASILADGSREGQTSLPIQGTTTVRLPTMSSLISVPISVRK